MDTSYMDLNEYFNRELVLSRFFKLFINTFWMAHWVEHVGCTGVPDYQKRDQESMRVHHPISYLFFICIMGLVWWTFLLILHSFYSSRSSDFNVNLERKVLWQNQWGIRVSSVVLSPTTYCPQPWGLKFWELLPTYTTEYGVLKPSGSH